MKNILLSVVVISALLVAGIGGTLADFSDSEEELGDSLQAGSMDLKVNGEDDPRVLPISMQTMVPEKSYHFEKTVMNDGSIPGFLYIHIKNVVCTETDDHGIHPEPEYVAEMGGKVGQETVPPLGVRCDMEKHIKVEILYDGVSVPLPDPNGDGVTKLDELECQQILIATLEECGVEHTIRFGFWLQDVPEEYYGHDIFTLVNDPHQKFNNWPTNCYMGDTVTFDVLYELLQVDP